MNRTGTAAAPPVTQSSELVEVRVLETLDEFRQCVALQHEVWGAEFEDVVPASLMRASAHVGGLTIGAFAADGVLLGFVFGVAGIEDGEPVHWSHMLGVRREARNRGVGRRLKESQRAELAARGVRRLYWTFDPLEARNAHLNLNLLGARVVDYVTDMYGLSRSTLHHGLATDRLIVECPTVPEENRSRVGEIGEVSVLPVFTPFPRGGDTLADGAAVTAVLIEVPWDMQSLAAESPERAMRWRAATRDVFLRVLGEGCEVVGLHRDFERSRVFFVVRRSTSTPLEIRQDR